MALAWFLWGSVLLRGELRKYVKKSSFENFESALYSTSVSVSLSRHFEKYLHGMVLKLSGHVRNTISLLYKLKTGWNFDLFSLKIRFLSPAICLKTSLWRHTLTNFHDSGINGKRRPYPIPWYQTIILWAHQFHVHNGGDNHPLGKQCYKKRLGRTRVKEFF